MNEAVLVLDMTRDSIAPQARAVEKRREILPRAAAYLSWIILMVADVSRTGIDVEALQARFTPTQTIETSKETLEWLKRQLPGSGS